MRSRGHVYTCGKVDVNLLRNLDVPRHLWQSWVPSPQIPGNGRPIPRLMDSPPGSWTHPPDIDPEFAQWPEIKILAHYLDETVKRLRAGHVIFNLILGEAAE